MKAGHFFVVFNSNLMRTEQKYNSFETRCMTRITIVLICNWILKNSTVKKPVTVEALMLCKKKEAYRSLNYDAGL